MFTTSAMALSSVLPAEQRCSLVPNHVYFRQRLGGCFSASGLQKPRRLRTKCQANDEVQPTSSLPSMGRRLSLALAAATSAAAARRAKGTPGKAVDVVEKSPLDNRNYKASTLRNGLRVLCCSDTAADRAAAALDVHVGYFSDPDDIPGLAHFCEHMLFLGTEPFPEENSFDTYLTANSGFSNAFTEAEDTCFFFSCGTSALRGALERFGAFFRAPLFTESATEREVNAINSEHLKNVPNDVFRLGQVLNTRANPAHPYHRFGTGNIKTLLEDTAARGINLRAELLAYYQRFYRAPLMTLCIIGKEPLSELQSYAERFFGEIPGDSGAVEPESRYWKDPLFLPAAFDKGVEVVPISDALSLQVGFPICFLQSSHVVADEEAPAAPPADGMTLASWRWYNPSSHVGAVLGHEGAQSLTALLRERGWITALETGSADNTSTFAMMLVGMELTAEGFKNQDEILKILFGFPASLAENLRLSECGWITREEPGPQDAAVELSGAMQDWAFPRDYIAGNTRLRDGPGLKGTVEALLANLQPSNALVTVVSRSCKGAETEKWYGTRYGFRDLHALKQQWQSAKLAPGLGVPPPNPFLPRQLELKAPRQQPDGLSKAFEGPRLRQEDDWKAYFRQDTEYGVPKAFVFVELPTAILCCDGKNAVAARIYEAMCLDALQEKLLYDAEVAGLAFNFSTSTRGVQLFFGGFDDRLADFASQAMDAVLSFEPNVAPGGFEAQRDKLRRELESFASQPPISQAAYWAGLALVMPEFSIEELQRSAREIRLSDVVQFASKLWDLARTELKTSLCWGNLRPAEGDMLVAKLRERLKSPGTTGKEAPQPRVAQLPVTPVGPGVALVHDVMDKLEENSAVEVLFQGGSTRGGGAAELQDLAELQVLASVMSDQFYEQLRTREQLGYIVSCRADRNEGVFSIVFVVQGAAKSALEVLARIDAFLDTVPGMLRAKTEAEITQLADSLAQAPAWVRYSDGAPILQLTDQQRRANPAAAAAFAVKTFENKPFLEACRCCGRWTASWCEGCHAVAASDPHWEFSAVCTVCDGEHIVCPRCRHHAITWETGHTAYETEFQEEAQAEIQFEPTGDGTFRATSIGPPAGDSRPPLPRKGTAPPPPPRPDLDPGLLELLASRPAGMAAFLQDLGVRTMADIRYMWESGHALTSEFERLAGPLSADLAFSVSSLWTLSMSRASTSTAAHVHALVQERESTIKRPVARDEPGEPPKILTYRRLIATGGTPETPTMATASSSSPYAKEQATRQAKLDSFFQLLMEDVIDLHAMGATMQQLQDPGSLQSLKAVVMATPSQMSTERISALMATFRRWKKFALAKQYPMKEPTALQLAEFLQTVSLGGPTASSAVWQSLKWFKEKLGVAFPVDHWLATPYRFLPTNHAAKQALELSPWEFVNLVQFAKKQTGTNLILAAFTLQCAVSCIRFEHVQRSRPASESRHAAFYRCSQGKRRVRGSRPGYTWATPEVQFQGFSLLKILVEFYKHECLSEVSFLWPQVQLEAADLWEIHQATPFLVDKRMSRTRFLEIFRGILHQLGLPPEEAGTSGYNRLRRFLPTLGNVLRLEPPEMQAVGSWVEVPAGGGPAPTVKSRATWLMGRHYAGAQADRSAAVKAALLERFWQLLRRKQGDLALTHSHMLPKGSWTWEEVAAANDDMPPLEIKPFQATAIDVEDPVALAAMETTPAVVEELQVDDAHSDNSSSTTSSSASDESARGSDVDGVIPYDNADQVKWIKQGAKVHLVRGLDENGRPVPWCRDVAYTQDAKSEGHGFATSAKQNFCQRCLARSPRGVYTAVAAQCGWAH
eukprot:s317_g4.t1